MPDLPGDETDGGTGDLDTEKAARRRGLANDLVNSWALTGRLFRPVVEPEAFPDFPAFVAVFSGFARPVSDLPEGVFGVANDVSDGFDRLGHGFPWCSEPERGRMTPSALSACAPVRD
jgi:hypothetical protein